jgi:gag-polypeptide of LTR copia-type
MATVVVEDGEKSSRVLAFDGRHESFKMWSRKFILRADTEYKDYQGVLLGTTTVPKESDVLDESVAAEAVLIKARKANKLALNDLIQSMTEEISFSLVDEAVTTNLPNGCAKTAWDKLLAKYEPKTDTAIMQVKKEFHTNGLSEGQDPDEWISELERQRQRIKKIKPAMAISDDELVIHILTNLTKEYDNIVDLNEDRVGAATNPLTIEELRTKLRQKFERLDASHKKKETDLALIGMQKRFKGTCNKCGKKGHKAEDCWSKDNEKVEDGGTARFNGKCHYCKKVGHKEQDCFKKKKDHPNGDEEVAEIMLMCGFVDGNMRDDDIWLADSCASTHFTNSLEGMFDVREVQKEVYVGDGKVMRVEAVGSKLVTVVQVDGMSTDVTLTDVMYTQEMVCNVVSMTKAMTEGFEISSTGKQLKMKKGTLEIVFDREFKSGIGFMLGVKMVPQDVPFTAFEKQKGGRVEQEEDDSETGRDSDEETMFTGDKVAAEFGLATMMEEEESDNDFEQKTVVTIKYEEVEIQEGVFKTIQVVDVEDGLYWVKSKTVHNRKGVEDPHKVESCVASVLERTKVDEPMCMASRTKKETNVESGVVYSTERERDRVSKSAVFKNI